MTKLSAEIKVLIVDDHEHVLWGLTKLIDGEWPRMLVVGSCRTVQEARALIAARKPDVVVLDVYLDDANAVDMLPAMVTPGGPDFVVHSGVVSDELRRHAMARGAKAYVPKDVPADELLLEIERVYFDRQGAKQ